MDISHDCTLMFDVCRGCDAGVVVEKGALGQKAAWEYPPRKHNFAPPNHAPNSKNGALYDLKLVIASEGITSGHKHHNYNIFWGQEGL